MSPAIDDLTALTRFSFHSFQRKKPHLVSCFDSFGLMNLTIFKGHGHQAKERHQWRRPWVPVVVKQNLQLLALLILQNPTFKSNWKHMKHPGGLEEAVPTPSSPPGHRQAIWPEDCQRLTAGTQHPPEVLETSTLKFEQVFLGSKLRTKAGV